MARINIEDELQEDPRFHMLEDAVGKIMALGIVAHSFKMAQFFWTKKDAPRSLIPKKLFLRNPEMQHLIDCELAIESIEGEIYVKGSEEKFAWIEQKREAGKKSGNLRRTKSNESEKSLNGIERVFNENERTLNETEMALNEIEPLTPTLAPTPVLIKKEKGKSPDEITPDVVISLFNKIIAGRGRVQFFGFFSLARPVLEEFVITSGFPEFRTKRQWEDYFTIVATRNKLLNFPATISFLVKHANAVEILSGGYQEQVSVSPYLKPPANKGRDMATKIYSQVLQNGMHGLKETLKSLEPIEVRALEKFGLASEIINCPSDFAATDIKNRLKIACDQAIQEQLVAS